MPSGSVIQNDSEKRIECSANSTMLQFGGLPLMTRGVVGGDFGGELADPARIGLVAGAET